MARRGIAVLIAALVAAGCGAASKRSTTGTAAPKYTLQQVKAAFAAEGITLDKMAHTRRLVVLRRAGWFGPFGYQRTGGWSGVSGSYSLTRPSVTQFLVFVGNGPHYEQRRNVFVGYSAGERATVRAALRHLGGADTIRQGAASLSGAQTCLERHGWHVERVAPNEIDSQQGNIVWDITFPRHGPPSVGWTGSSSGNAPSGLARCVYGLGG